MKKDKSMKENLLDEKGSSLKGMLGMEKDEKDEPSEYEIYSMDIFLHYDEFNDGYLMKPDLELFYDHVKESRGFDEKKLERFRSLWEGYKDTKLVDFVSFTTLLNKAEYDTDGLN